MRSSMYSITSPSLSPANRPWCRHWSPGTGARRLPVRIRARPLRPTCLGRLMRQSRIMGSMSSTFGRGAVASSPWGSSGRTPVQLSQTSQRVRGGLPKWALM